MVLNPEEIPFYLLKEHRTNIGTRDIIKCDIFLHIVCYPLNLYFPAFEKNADCFLRNASPLFWAPYKKQMKI